MADMIGVGFNSGLTTSSEDPVANTHGQISTSGGHTIHYGDAHLRMEKLSAYAEDTGLLVGRVGTGALTGSTLQLESFTTTERGYMTGAAGMIVYNETTDQFEGYISTGWAALGGGSGSGKQLAPTYAVGSKDAGDTIDDCDYLHENGVTDALATALAAANAAGSGEVYIRRGYYITQAHINITSPVTMRGEGVASTVVDLASTSTLLTGNLVYSGHYGSAIMDMTIQPSATSSTQDSCIHLGSGLSGFTMQRVRVVPQAGEFLEAVIQVGHTSSDVHLVDVHYDDDGLLATNTFIQIKEDCTDVHVDRCNIRSVVPIEIVGGTGIWINSNRLRSRVSGIQSYACISIQAEGNIEDLKVINNNMDCAFYFTPVGIGTRWLRRLLFTGNHIKHIFTTADFPFIGAGFWVNGTLGNDGLEEARIVGNRFEAWGGVSVNPWYGFLFNGRASDVILSDNTIVMPECTSGTALYTANCSNFTVDTLRITLNGEDPTGYWVNGGFDQPISGILFSVDVATFGSNVYGMYLDTLGRSPITRCSLEDASTVNVGIFTIGCSLMTVVANVMEVASGWAFYDTGTSSRCYVDANTLNNITAGGFTVGTNV